MYGANSSHHKNVPIEREENVLNKRSGHVSPIRKNIKLLNVVAFVEKCFDERKEGTSFANVENEFRINKARAQRILKIATQKQFLFTPGRKNPQKYYPDSRHYAVIEYLNNKENVPKQTTDAKSPISNCLEYQKAKNFLDVLSKLPFTPLMMHKIVVEMMLDIQFYDLINVKAWKKNLGRLYSETIDKIDVNFVYYKNGKLLVYIVCSNRPFKIETEEDLAILYSFFGQVRDRLEYQISDPHGRLVPNISKWVLKQCEFNKDVPITDKAQLTIPDIQLSTALQTFRMYVKNLNGRANHRCETSMEINQLLPTYLSSNINPSIEILSKLDSLTRDLESIKKTLGIHFHTKPCCI